MREWIIHEISGDCKRKRVFSAKGLFKYKKIWYIQYSDKESEAIFLDKRPQGREKYVTNNSKGVKRRGEGLNMGSVGGEETRPGFGAQQRTGSAGGGRTTRAGGTRSLVGIIAAAVLLLGGGGGLFSSGLLGGDSGESGYTYTEPSSGSASGSVSGSYENYSSALESLFGSASSGSDPYASLFGSGSGSGASPSSSGGSSYVNTNTGSVDDSVASGSRAKRTVIKGKGKDTVTVMLYMCGTDLESRSAMATKDLLEMTKATLSDKVNVIVYTGGCTRWNNQIMSNSVNQIYKVENGQLRRLVSDAGNVSMTEPSTLSSFIRWCAENYPANRNELILWDHGGGSVSGYGYDQKFQRSGSMTLAGLNTALKDAGVSFDFVGFDACLMATVETGLMLDPYADYMIASEETEPGIGWYYTDWLTRLSSDTSLPTTTIGKLIVDGFVSTCQSQTRGQSATFSVVDVAELANTVPAKLKAFSKSISGLVNGDSYKQVSTARNNTREFARSTMIDQIDLVHFAKNLGTEEGKALAQALQSAVKYNRTTSDMSNAYGLSIYFPYRKASSVDSAIKTYKAIGLDESYSQCIRDFASLEVSGQVSTGGTSNPYASLWGGASGYGSGSSSSYSSYDSAEMINELLGAFLGGNYGSVNGLSGSNTDFFFGRSMSTEDTVAYLADNRFDAASLTWTRNGAGELVIALPDEQWALVEGLDLNLFVDDGSGYIDMGYDNVFAFDDEGNLLAPEDDTWLAVNGQPVAYYHENTTGEGSGTVITGRIPALLNGDYVHLLVRFDAEHPHGAIVGARSVYADGETETVAKSYLDPDAEEPSPLRAGDTLDFLCDYYRYDGSFDNSYFLGEQMTVTEDMEISNVSVGANVSLCFRFTDLYQQHYWTPVLTSR